MPKASKKKKKENPYHKEMICDKEVVIQTEKLTDAFIAEMTGNSSALQLPQKPDDGVKDINTLPPEVMLKILFYLTQNQLAQVARVCRSWNMLIKSAVLWKKVDVKVYCRNASPNKAATKLIENLPACTTHIRLHFTAFRSCIEKLHFEQLCVTLQEKCPQLQMLFLQRAVTDNLLSVIDLCIQHLQKVKILAFHHCIFSGCATAEECSDVSEVEVLDLSWCYFEHFSKPHFSKTPSLKKLYLRNANESYSWFEGNVTFLHQLEVLTVRNAKMSSGAFQTIATHGKNLKELYMCYTDLKDDDFKFTDLVFPHLQTICLNVCYGITWKTIASLSQSCRSLQNIYVDEKVVESLQEQPDVVKSKCKSGVLKVVSCNVHEKINYFCD